MNTNARASRSRLAPMLLLALGLTGCGSDVRITGKVSKGGQPVNAVKGTRVDLGFHPMTEAAPAADGKRSAGPDLYAANVADDGTFDVPGIDGDGIPPGKYRVSVSVRAGRDRSGTKKKGNIDTSDKDLLNGAFGPDNSPIVRELKSSTRLDIDLDKPTG